MLYTNKVKIELNHANIHDAFEIYYVEKRVGEFYKDNVLDHMLYTYKARSVCANGLNKCYVLLKKGEGDQFISEITRAYPDTIVEAISFSTQEELEEQIPNTNVIVARLLINQMQQSHIESLRYNNIMGNLFLPCYHKNKKVGDVEYKRFYEIKLTPNSVLKIAMKSFKSSSKGRYIMDPVTGILRVRLSQDDPATLYTTGSMKHNKGVVNFIDFTDPVKNEKTKMGQLDIVLNDVEKKLGDYMKMELVPLIDGIEVEQPPSLNKKNQSQRILSHIKEGGLNLEDLIQDENSPLDIKYIKHHLQEEYGIESLEGGGRYTLKLVQDPEYYQVMKEPDPYEQWSPHNICQHLIRDNIKGDNIRNILYKILQELCIKSDIADKKITVVNWADFQLEKEWTFVSRTEIPQEKWSRDKQYHYREVKVHKDGTMVFRTHQTDTTPPTAPEVQYWDDIVTTYELYKEKSKYQDKTIEGLLYWDPANILAIMSTQELIIPEVQKIQKTLLMLDPKGTFDKQELLTYLTGFKCLHPQYLHEITAVEDLVEKEETITYATLKKLINTKSDKGKLFNTYLMDRCSKLLYAPIRSEEQKAEYGVAHFRGIHYYEDKNRNTISYYVGSNQALNQNLARGVAIREISSLIEEVDCQEILKLTSVEFVRSGQYTVLPFLYKYLRELPY